MNSVLDLYLALVFAVLWRDARGAARWIWAASSAAFAIDGVETAPTWVLYGALLVAGFLVGYVPGYVATRSARRWRGRW